MCCYQDLNGPGFPGSELILRPRGEVGLQVLFRFLLGLGQFFDLLAHAIHSFDELRQLGVDPRSGLSLSPRESLEFVLGSDLSFCERSHHLFQSPDLAVVEGEMFFSGHWS